MSTKLNYLKWNFSLLVTVISLLTFSVALAASGDLDTTFGGDGRVTTNFGAPNPGRHDAALGMAIQADGKIVAVGLSAVPGKNQEDFAIARYNTDGSLDTTFHFDGKRLTDFGGVEEAADVAIQSNGKIVVVGIVGSAPGTIGIFDAAIARYNSDGTLDTTFSGDGKQTTDFGGDKNSLEGVAIQSNGKIVAVGPMGNGDNTNFAVYRYLSDGSLDPTFSGDGKVSIGFGIGRQDFAYDVAIQSDGKIIVVGTTGDANASNSNFAVARLNRNGTLDTTFSGDGRQITSLGGDDLAFALALQPDGKIVVAGVKNITNFRSFAVARYDTNGSLDMTFNGSGRKAFPIISGEPSEAADVTVQSDGKILIGGSTGNGGQFDFAIVRLTPSGGFDKAFSGDGKVIVDFGGYEFGSAFAVQPSNGRYILAGNTVSGAQQDFALARVLP
jgi:uncharacterized delta-60 repeat protein